MKKRIILSIAALMALSSLLVGCTKNDAEPAPINNNVSSNEEESAISQIKTKDEFETKDTILIEPTPEITKESTTAESTAPVEQTPTEQVEPQEEATTAPSTEPTTEPEQPKTSKVASIEEIKAVLNDESFDIIPLDTGDTVQYVQTNCNLRSGPGTNFDKIGSLQTNQEVIAHALAPTGELWCQLIDEEGNEVGYVYYDYLGDSKVQTQKKTQIQSQPASQSQPAQPEQPQAAPQEVQTEPPVQQPTNKSIAELLGNNNTSSFSDIPMGTGDGSCANGMFGGFE